MTNTLEHFKRIAPRYELFRPAHPPLLQQIAQTLGIEAGQRWLDVGCGVGSDLAWFKQHYCVMAIGVDRDENMCREARAKLGTESVICSDALVYLQNIDNYFDAVMIKFSAHHFEQFDQLFDSLLKALLRGGRIAVVTMLPDDVPTYPLTKFFPTLNLLMLQAANQQKQLGEILSHHIDVVDFESTPVEIATEFLDDSMIKRIEEKYISFLDSVSVAEIEKGLSQIRRVISNLSVPSIISVKGTLLHGRKKRR